MLNYLVRRLLLGTFTLLLISFLVYALIRNMPGTPLTLSKGKTRAARSAHERLRTDEEEFTAWTSPGTRPTSIG